MRNPNFEYRMRQNLEFLLVSAPVVLLFALFSATAWPEDHVVSEFGEAFGVSLLLICIVGRCWAILSSEIDGDGLPAIQGPYRFVAHPLYFFGSLGLASIGLMLSSISMGVMFFIAGFVVSRFLIGIAYRHAHRLRPDETELYNKLVPDFFPTLAPRITSDQAVDTLRYSQDTLKRCIGDALVFAMFFPLVELIDWAHESGFVAARLLLY